MYQPIPITIPKITKQLFNGEERECIFVEIVDEEYIACDKASYNFWGSSKRGTYGKGLLNSENDLKRTERIGLLGQMAWGKITNEPVDLEYRRGGDKQDALIFGKYKLDIKCASYNYGVNLIQKINEFKGPQKIDKDVYVSSFLHSEDRKAKIAVICLVGFSLQEDVLKAKVVPARRGNHINYEIPFEKTKSIIYLIEKINEFKEKQKLIKNTLLGKL